MSQNQDLDIMDAPQTHPELFRRLTGLYKTQLVRMARKFGWIGDDARTTVSTLREYLMERDHDQVNSLIDEMRQEPRETTMTASSSNNELDTLKNALMQLLGTPKLDMDAIKADIETLVADAVQRMEPRRVYITPAGEWAPPDGQFVHNQFDTVARLAAARLNILLVGPSGSGKTQLAEQVAEALKLPFYSLSCSAGMSESEFKGWLLPIGEGGKFTYVSADYIDAYENGGVFLIDEVDAGDENATIFLNKSLSNGHFHIPTRFGNTLVKRHPDFICIAAANTWGHGADRIYAGRNKLDGAFLDRFRAQQVLMDYDAKLEEALIDPKVLGFLRALRAKIAEHKLTRFASTRVGIDMSKQLVAGFTLSDCKTRFFSDWTADERRKVSDLI